MTLVEQDPRLPGPAIDAPSAPTGLFPLARAVATGLGSGYSPVAPGTAGSVVGLALYWPLASAPVPWAIGFLAVLFGAGVAASTAMARRLGIEDPGVVVIDEVVGMWISLLFLPFTWKTVVLGFFLFRVMDIVKPYPARQLENLPGGWGIMLDDVMAGIYANLALRVVLLVWPA